MRRRRWIVLTAGIALSLVLPTLSARAEPSIDEKEAAVRAAFLYRLAFFVSWSDQAFENAESPIRFCVLAERDSRVGALLRTQAGTRKVNDRPIEVEQIRSATLPPSCHIVYMEDTERNPEPVAEASPHQVMVGDSVKALGSGATLALVPEVGGRGELRLGFVSRRERVQSAGFQLSAKLLQLVRFEDAGSDR